MVKWGQLKRFLLAREFEIRGSGGDKMVIAPAGHVIPPPPRGRKTVLIGHTSCTQEGDTVLPCYINKVCHAFGYTKADIEAA